MTCEQVRHHLGGYVLGGLSVAEQADTRAHLQRCRDCRDDLAQLEGLPRLLDLVAQEPAQPPSSLRDRVVAAAPRARSKRWLAVAAAAALVIAVAAALSGGPAEAPPTGSLVLALRASEGFTANGTAAFQTTGDRLRVDIVLEGVEALERGATYEAWLAEPERGLVSLGRFRPDISGRAEVGFTAQAPLSRYSWLWVTAEPDARDPAHDGPTVVRERIPGDW